MAKAFVVCSILAEEVESIMKEWGLDNKLHYIQAALHVDLDKMERALTDALDSLKDGTQQPALIVGTKCHPAIQSIADRYGAGIINGSNCIEMLLGEEKMRELESECNTFYITGGWLKNWRSIFCEGGLGWDCVDARINFGRYERILLLDTGLAEIADEDILEFFEYTEVPIETYPATLDCLKEKLRDLLG